MQFLAILSVTACKQVREVSGRTQLAGKHVKFNHLYVVLDTLTYNYLSDSLPLVDQFSVFKVSSTSTPTESWSGKYLYGKNHYLEIFKPEGYRGAAIGDLGMGFMPNKLGTLDSIDYHWRKTFGAVNRIDKDLIDSGVTYKWFTSLSLPDKDSLKLHIWLMEHSREEMLYAGFREEDLDKEIEYWDFLKSMRAKTTKTTLDSIRYDQLFDKVSSVKLRVSNKELTFLRKNLLTLGFFEGKKVFHGNDIDIMYEVTESPHFILQQIDFLLTRRTTGKELVLNRLAIRIRGNKASFIFNY